MAEQNAERNEERKHFDIPHEVELSVPVKWGKDEERTKITVTRRLKAGDFKGISANDIRFDDMMKLASKITGEPRSFIEELDSIDFFKLTEVINSFLPVSQTTGENG